MVQLDTKYKYMVHFIQYNIYTIYSGYHYQTAPRKEDINQKKKKKTGYIVFSGDKSHPTQSTW